MRNKTVIYIPFFNLLFLFILEIDSQISQKLPDYDRKSDEEDEYHSNG